MKKILGIVILLALGGFMVLGGIGQTTTDEVTCGGEVMVPGDICQETRGGSTTEYTYDEQKASDRSSGWVLVGIGGVLLAAGLASGVAAVVGRNRRSPAPAPAPHPGPQPGPAPYRGGPAPFPGGPAPYPAPNGARAPYPQHPGAGGAPSAYPHR
jgi:hypothetical protein